MNNKLQVNPFLQLFFSADASEKFLLTAPKPNCGQQELIIKKEEFPNLYEVFLDLQQTKFEFLDVNLDIDENERKLLFEKGILVDSEELPQKILFGCQLEDVEAVEFLGDLKDLIVNPTFRFEPFDFGNFIKLVHLHHFSPHQATVWIKQPITDLEIGFWLDDHQTELITKLIAGQKLEFEIEENLLKKLISAEILTTQRNLEAKEKKIAEELNQAKKDFKNFGYFVVRQLLPQSQMGAMRHYYRQYIAGGFMPIDGHQSWRYYQHNEPLSRFFHQNLTKLVSLIAGQEVIPSYVYAASYIENADLKPHTDRAQCEFSISFQVDYLPEQDNQLSPWGLFLYQPEESKGRAITYFSEKFPANSEAEDENKRVYLACGDGLVYKGRELIHYRYSLPPGHQSTSLFFHYVPKDFVGKLD